VDRYRLAAVRDARSRDERVKRGDYADAVADASTSQARIDAAERRVSELRAVIASHLRGNLPVTAGELVRRERFVAKLRRDLEAARVAVDQARAAHAGTVAEVDLARGKLVRARADKQVIERHFEGWRAQQVKLADRRED
jgi:hypothetical protein